MHLPTTLTTVFGLLQLTLAQKVFINKVPLYSSLPSCAVVPLSTIVRDMEQGCGDGGATTSFSCFCTASSSAFESKISKAVSKNCTDDSVGKTTGVEEALDVFSSYCDMGAANGTVSSVPASTTGSAANITTSTISANGSSSTPLSVSLSSRTSALAPAGTSTAASPSNTSGAERLIGRRFGAIVGGIMVALTGLLVMG